MPKFVRASAIIAGVLATALAPLFVSLSVAESYGWERENARSVAFAITILLFGVWYLVLRRIGRRQARREVAEELDRTLAQYRNDDRKDEE